MKYGIKSIDNLPEEDLNKIEGVSDERGFGDGFWIYIKSDYYNPTDPGSHSIHEDTIAECISKLRDCKLIQNEYCK